MSGWKDWAIGEVVTESEFQSFVQDQVVQVYDDATDRDNTLGANVSEGMVCYLKDVNETQVYDGTNWVQVGEGDITGVTAGDGLTGGGTSGDVSLDVDMTYINANASIAQSQVTDLTTDLADKADASDFTGGTEGFTAVSNGTAGLSYQPVSPNYIINGAFDIWQRGDTVSETTVGAFYSADRWEIQGGGFDKTVTKAEPTLSDFQYAARVQRDEGETLTGNLRIGTSLETKNSIPLAGKPITISYYARKGADYSAAGDLLQLLFKQGTGVDEDGVAGVFTGQVNQTREVTLTTSWQKFTFTTSVNSFTTQIAIMFTSFTTGTAGADDWFEITGVQLEAGSIATPFKRNANSIQGELEACQRYYQRLEAPREYVQFANGFNYKTGEARGVLSFPVKMRVPPTSIILGSGASDYSILTTDGNQTCTGVPSLQGETENSILLRFFSTGNLTAGEGCMFRGSNTFLAFETEL